MRNLLIILMVFVSPTMVAPTGNVIEVEIIEPKTEIKDQNKFLNDIGFRESGNRYDVVNQFGYMGKYQFGKSTLRTLKIKVTKDAFLNSPDLQEYAMIQNLNYNKNKLQKYIDQFEGQEINGILITESGILAAAHLAGAGNVRKFFRNGKEFKDGFGTSMTSYMTEFGGYKLNL
ncbi:hypothetical protein CMO95_01080 [Candidatus Woesearchaeota archaeon]|nr:hypothetical protein [Candidatus Woesearchaeota archaeon]|tara:strand:+ start:694 stop:1215 length:522 start_codon:yes stop_codon:yes gene_type:complete